MTAEIAIMNKRAIALAADSTVTIGNSEGNGDKFYNTANKIFTLSKYHPIGFMVYNNAEFMGFPWEIIVKQYRNKISSKKFDNLNDYCENFLKYLADTELQPEKYEERYIGEILIEFIEILNDEMVSKHNKLVEDYQRPIKEEELKEIKELIIQEVFTSINNKDDIYDIPVNHILDKHSGTIEKYIKVFLGETKLDKKSEIMLKKCCSLIFKKDFIGETYSGIVIAGFGSKDIFPSLISFNISGLVKGTLRYNNRKQYNIDIKKDCQIIPFAQTDTVNTFLRGISTNHIDYMNESFLNNIKQSVDNIKGIEESKLNEIKENINNKWKKVVQDTINYSVKNYVLPIYNAIRFSPKDELASIAKSLVNLTSLKRQVSLDKYYQTVGGPIDVAVISKGDGFVWIERKHYFRPELNHHFFDNYYNNCEGGADE